MHPAISYRLAQAHVADLRHRAERDTLARAARRARRNQRYMPSHASGLGRRAQAGLGPEVPAPGTQSRRAPGDRFIPTIGTCHEPVPAVGRLIRFLGEQATASP